MKTRSWIGKITLSAIAVVAVVTGMLLAAAPASAAQAISIARTTMHGDHMRHSYEHHGGHDPRHHFYGRPNGTYFIYPYPYSWTYRYPAPAYRVPTYWYYCPSYGAYYPYVSSCSESWVPVPAS